MICDKCGNLDTRGAALQVEIIENGTDARMYVPRKSYKATSGEGFRTLFLGVVRKTVLTDCMYAAPTTPAQFYNKRIIPVLKKLQDAGVKFIGEILEPARLALAVTDLTIPEAIFHYVTVVDDGTVEDTVKKLGLERILVEGPVSTIDDKDWFTAEIE